MERRISWVKYKKNILLITVMIFCVFSFLGSANAEKYLLGPDTNLEIGVIGTYGVGMRVTTQDDQFLKDINTDDGNRSFDQWDLYNNKVTAIADIEFMHKNFGVFVRPKAFYDYAYMHDNANDSPRTNNAYIAGLISKPDQWADEVEDAHGMKAEILDAFAYSRFRLGEVPFNLRVGKQVISWGESSLIPGISSAQAPTDSAAAQAVGTETKEIYLPTGAAYIQTGFGDVGLRAYYQWEWEQGRMTESGNFFSTADYLDKIGTPRLRDLGGGRLYSISRIADDDPRDDGQYGAALTYVLPWNSTEIGMYYINYHDKAPILDFVSRPGRFNLSFTEDIKLYGFSAGSVIGDATVGAEVAYREGIRFQTTTIEEGDYLQAQANFTYGFNPHFFADRILVMGEAAYGEQISFRNNVYTWRYSAQVRCDWYQMFPRTDTGFDLKFSTTPQGTISTMGFREDFAAGSIGVRFTYNDRLKGELVYENRWDANSLGDRDTVSFKLSYPFL